jgi:hypothetical protein
LSRVDLVIVEGYKTQSHPKLEVHRPRSASLCSPNDRTSSRSPSDVAAATCSCRSPISTTSTRSPISSTSGAAYPPWKWIKCAVVGLVLAGGALVRFGGEKAVALLDDRPLLDGRPKRLLFGVARASRSTCVPERGGDRAQAKAADALRRAGDALGSRSRCVKVG